MTIGLPKTGRGFSGKLLLTIITVTVAAGSFSLGYFVGKTSPSTRTTHLAVQPVLQKPSGAAAPRETGVTKPSEFAPPGSPSPEQTVKKEEKLPTSESVVPVREPKQTPTEPTTGGITKSATAQHNEKEGLPEAANEQKTQGNAVLYAVQVGAFKSRREANTMQAELEGKGYKARSLKASSKGATFFKVTVGEFAQKREAEVVALKLRKTEGLKAFVTRKN
ncbi:MAG: SPOR domain-containing protein [Thermodesulfovibrionales bacterium]|jgi:cell division septation protein DedD